MFLVPGHWGKSAPPIRDRGLRSALIFRSSFLGPDLSQMVAQSEYSSDLGAQEAPFWLPFCSPFWVRRQKWKLSSRVHGNPPEALGADPTIDKKTGQVLKRLPDPLF